MTERARFRYSVARLALGALVTALALSAALPARAQTETGAICVATYADLNGNAIREETETPLAGITVNLSTGGEVIATHVIAEGEAQYCFENLLTGAYTITFVDDPAFRSTTANEGTFNLDPGQRLTITDYGAVPASATTAQADLVALIESLNADPAIHGILVQLPLPGHIDSGAIIQTIAPEKDVDGLHAINVGKLWSGLPGLVPCTPRGVMRLLEESGIELAGKRAIVIGRSNLVGKPVAALLLAKNCTVTLAHSRTEELPARCREADIVIAAVGKAKLVGPDWIRPGATVIDVGMNRDEAGRLCGDVDFDSVVEVAGAITLVPGGVGPMTINTLIMQTLEAAEFAISADAGAVTGR